MKLYGNLLNRVQENVHSPEPITVGMGVTEFLWSDRKAYEVVEVRDQKHVSIRELDHKKAGEGHYTNNWELISNERNPVFSLVKRGNYWYHHVTFTSDLLDKIDDDVEILIALMQNGIDTEELRKKGKINKYYRFNCAFGYADYYHDYEF